MSSLIVAAELGPADFAWLDGLRREHYPRERNRVPAHLTLFRSLPPSAEGEARRVLSLTSLLPPPSAMISGLMDLDTGVAVRVHSDDLDEIRDSLAEQFHGLLSAQDRGGWLPHVTVQNKVQPMVARALMRSLARQLTPKPLAIRGLQLIRYREGEWEPLQSWRFRGVIPDRRPG